MEEMRNDKLVEALAAKALELGQLMQEAARRTGRPKHEFITEFTQGWMSGIPVPDTRPVLLSYLNAQHPQTQ